MTKNSRNSGNSITPKIICLKILLVEGFYKGLSSPSLWLLSIKGLPVYHLFRANFEKLSWRLRQTSLPNRFWKTQFEVIPDVALLSFFFNFFNTFSPGSKLTRQPSVSQQYSHSNTLRGFCWQLWTRFFSQQNTYCNDHGTGLTCMLCFSNCIYSIALPNTFCNFRSSPQLPLSGFHIVKH